jgi:hypothetical protein
MSGELTIIPQGGNEREMAFGGGLEGADRLSRETATWRPASCRPIRRST